MIIFIKNLISIWILIWFFYRFLFKQSNPFMATSFALNTPPLFNIWGIYKKLSCRCCCNSSNELILWKNSAWFLNRATCGCKSAKHCLKLRWFCSRCWINVGKLLRFNKQNGYSARSLISTITTPQFGSCCIAWCSRENTFFGIKVTSQGTNST